MRYVSEQTGSAASSATVSVDRIIVARRQSYRDTKKEKVSIWPRDANIYIHVYTNRRRRACGRKNPKNTYTRRWTNRTCVVHLSCIVFRAIPDDYSAVYIRRFLLIDPKLFWNKQSWSRKKIFIEINILIRLSIEKSTAVDSYVSQDLKKIGTVFVLNIFM